MAASRRVLPVAVVKLPIGRRLRVAADPEQGAEGVERVEPAVKAERELVEVGLQVLLADPVMTAAQPAFEVAKNQMHYGEVFFRHLGVAVLGRGQMLIPALGKLAVAVPAIGDDHGAGQDSALHEAAQRLPTPVRNNGQAQPTGIAPAAPGLGVAALLRLPLADFDGGSNQDLIVNATAFAACRPVDPRFVNLNVVFAGRADPVSVGADHTSPELVQDLEGRLVPAEAKLALKLGGAHTRRVAGDQIRGPEPDVQRGLGVLHDRPGLERRVLAALPATQHAGARHEAERLPSPTAVGADKPVFPADALKVGRARRVVREQPLELRQRLGERQIGMEEDIRGHDLLRRPEAVSPAQNAALNRTTPVFLLPVEVGGYLVKENPLSFQARKATAEPPRQLGNACELNGEVVMAARPIDDGRSLNTAPAVVVREAHQVHGRQRNPRAFDQHGAFRLGDAPGDQRGQQPNFGIVVKEQRLALLFVVGEAEGLVVRPPLPLKTPANSLFHFERARRSGNPGNILALLPHVPAVGVLVAGPAFNIATDPAFNVRMEPIVVGMLIINHTADKADLIIRVLVNKEFRHDSRVIPARKPSNNFHSQSLRSPSKSSISCCGCQPDKHASMVLKATK